MISEASDVNRKNQKLLSKERGAEEEGGIRRSLSSMFKKKKSRPVSLPPDSDPAEMEADYEELENNYDEGEEDPEQERIVHNIKVIVVGDAGVGKTSLIHQLTRKKFSQQVMTTLGVDYSAKNLPGPGQTTIRLNLWDVAGQERYRVLSRAYLRGCQAAVVVFDVTRPETLQQVAVWKKDIDAKCGQIPSLLLGNKKDLGGIVTEHQLVETQNLLNFSSASFSTAIEYDALEAVVRQFADQVRQGELGDGATAGSGPRQTR